MSKVVVFTNLTLDGVMQAPGRPDEDRRGGFEHGGWAAPYAAMTAAGESTPHFGALLLGRWTYEEFYAYWPKQKDSPFSAILDNMQKYVASTTLSEPLAWINSTLLKGDAAETVARLKQESGTDLVIMGSGELVQSLDGGAFATLQLVNTRTTTTGVVVATYQPVEPASNKTTGAATH